MDNVREIGGSPTKTAGADGSGGDGEMRYDDDGNVIKPEGAAKMKKVHSMRGLRSRTKLDISESKLVQQPNGQFVDFV